MGELMGLSKKDCDILQMAAPMHDVGKIGIPDAILNKPGRYTCDEFEQMKHHAAFGTQYSQRLHNAYRCDQRDHHSVNIMNTGTAGLPLGLHGGNPYFGQIVALADVF